MEVYGVYYKNLSEYKHTLRKRRTYTKRTVRLTRKWYRESPTDFNRELLIKALLQAGNVYTDCKLVNI